MCVNYEAAHSHIGPSLTAQQLSVALVSSVLISLNLHSCMEAFSHTQSCTHSHTHLFTYPLDWRTHIKNRPPYTQKYLQQENACNSLDAIG